MPTMTFPDPSLDEARWSGVCNRDRSLDGQFVYAVRTTGVYCRPSCGARQALRKNVSFFECCEDAERAGFRPCKRCKPTLDANHQAELIAKACAVIEAAESAPSLDELASVAGMSPFHFHRVFKSITGVTPKAYADARRADRLRKGLDRAETITRSLYEAGYNSSSRLYARSSELLGMTPGTFRAGGTGEEIRFAIGECSLGSVLVAATEKGVCAIEFGDDPDALLRSLQDRFPKARLIGGDPAFEQTVARVVALVEQPDQACDLPLDVRGTAFQQRIWEAIRNIPAGETASYADVARRIGQPSAVRAVAQACGANRLAVAIPCHRVVRTDGAVSGYRWGIERKVALLKREAP